MRICFYLLVLSLIACSDHYYDNGGYNSGYGGGYYDPYDRYDRNDYDRDRYRDRQERERLERERDRLEDERRRLEEERRRREKEAYQRPVSPPVYSPPKREERCPSGFSPSERKCTTEERRKGCKDMRLPGGLGCVKR